MRDVTHMSEYEGRKLCVRLTRDSYVKINEGHDSYAADIGSISSEFWTLCIHERKTERPANKPSSGIRPDPTSTKSLCSFDICSVCKMSCLFDHPDVKHMVLSTETDTFESFLQFPSLVTPSSWCVCSVDCCKCNQVILT